MSYCHDKWQQHILTAVICNNRLIDEEGICKLSNNNSGIA